MKMPLVNDIHSQLNPTRVARIARPWSLESIRKALWRARREGIPVCIAGGRHSMGGQQFAAGAVLMDTTRLNRVLRLDLDAGTIEVQGGIQWPGLVQYLLREQKGLSRQWGIVQKQTGADRLSIGGALASNVHSRGLKMKPIIADVESFVLVDAEGNIQTCSRGQNTKLFRLAIGGYGLFGIMYSVTLRLARRSKVRRFVEIITIEELMPAFQQRIDEGFLYGDFQYLTDERSPDFLRKGVFSCYGPVEPATALTDQGKGITRRQWLELVYLAHIDKARAFQLYADYYKSSSGRVTWSDTHQLSTYLDNYHHGLQRRMGDPHPASEMITEIFVPRDRLGDFMEEVRQDFRDHGVNVIYGTIRLVEKDTESFLAWAREAWVGVIFNLHITHTREGLEHGAAALRRLIDMGIRRQGSYYLTYHSFATCAQVEACYPQFAEFLRLKQEYDPVEQFQSEWYRRHKAMFAGAQDCGKK